MGKRMNIALFMGMIENDFSYSICEGVMMGAKSIDANLFILPAGIINAVYDDEQSNYYRYQYNTLYSFANMPSLDAILIEYGTVTSFLNEEEQKEFLSQFGDVPVILLYGDKPGFSSACIDNRAGMRHAITHLVEHHECQHIAFVSGPASNLDAAERLQVYRDVMAEHNLVVPEDYVIYGNFSEYCREDVIDFLKKHPEVEAIACANDDMAKGVYRALEELNLHPGVDVLVTGFDDSPTAMMVEPHMTTVKADVKELAYAAVLECPNVIAGKEVHKLVESKLVTRGSCGCNNLDSVNASFRSDITFMEEQQILELADQVYERHFNIYFGDKSIKKIQKILQDFFIYVFHLVTKDGKLLLDRKDFSTEFLKYASVYKKGYVDLDVFFSINSTLCGCLCPLLASAEDQLVLVQEFAVMNQELMLSVTKQSVAVDDEMKLFEVLLSTTTRDMLQFANEERRRYNTIIKKFKMLKFQSSYLFSYGDGIVHERDEKWTMPEALYLNAYHNNDEQGLYKGKEKKIVTQNIFSSDLMPNDRRIDMLVMPLFSGVRQYGLLFTESTINYFRYATEMACQVSVSLEVILLLEEQNLIKQELEQSLQETVERNRELDEMSRIDPLTQIANRRGFITKVKQLVTNPHNKGKRAVAVYADMDNLKIVNDEFGHDDGDFALTSIAHILTDSFRESDVVGRMGGDEFAAFAIVNQEDYCNIIRERIRNVSKEFNDHCDKPYYVNMSVGVYEFVIDEGINIEHMLNAADENLYQEKKTKKKVVYKNSNI
ncbi:MAG: GGDEF domain-containing protein [Lachnospira sp.]|nr:GGDEF domain-containing protein [Lachnospira sp.]